MTGPTTITMTAGTSHSVAPLIDLAAHPRGRRPILFGYLTIAIAVGGFATWAATAPLSSAVVAPGMIRVDTNHKTVQHVQGGIVAELLVREGQRVKSGQVLLRLDDLETRSQYDMLDSQHVSLLAEEARLIAERDGQPNIEFAPSLLARRSDLRVAEAMMGQQSIFNQERVTMAGQIGVLEQRIGQLKAQIKSLEAQMTAGAEQLRLIREEMTGVADLVEKGYEKRPRLLALQRTAAGLEGSQGELRGRIAMSRQAIGEAEMQIANIRQTRLRESVSALRDNQTKRAEIAERLSTANSQQTRRDILAPDDGVVLNLKYFSSGTVIPPGGAILDIVPDKDRLVVEARVQPTNIDEVREGLPAEIALTAFKSRTTPRLKGEVTRVSADTLSDETGSAYFATRVELDPNDLAQVPEIFLNPGMPAEVFITTGERTLLDYLVQPLRDSFHRAFREQ